MERAIYLSTRTNVFFTYQEMSFQLIYGHEHKTQAVFKCLQTSFASASHSKQTIIKPTSFHF